MRYANVMSTLALFVALGGTGYAALKLPRNSVGAKQIRTGAVRSAEVKDHSLKAADFAAVPQGPKGDTGDAGAPGAPGKDATQVVLATGSDSSATDIDIGAFNTVADSRELRSVITTPAPSRIVAQAAVSLKDLTVALPPVPADARCKLSLDDPPPALATGTLISQEISARLPSVDTAHTSLAVAGRSALLPAGTYYVTLHCLSNESGATFDAGDLTVLAVAG
jgi:hypothetical protein